MEASPAPQAQVPRGGRPPRTRQHTRYDQALFAAKNAGRKVTFTMACDTLDTDDDCSFKCSIKEVDRFSILVIFGDGREVWIAKTAIVQTEVEVLL